MRAAFTLLVIASLTIPIVTATPIPEEVYEVVVMSAVWGPGIGYLWGHPSQGARMWLETAGGYAEFGFTIGGIQMHQATSLGTLTLDRWTGPNNDRFVAGFFKEDGPDEQARAAANLTAFGGGKLNGFTITVVGHT